MKKIICGFLLAFTGCLYAQGTLQFNRVVILSGAQTVPTGKVWKIESLIMPSPSFIKYTGSVGGSCGCDPSSSYSHYNYVTDYAGPFFAGKNNIRINGEDIVYSNTTVWLNAGSTVEPITLTTPLQPASPGGCSCYGTYWIDGVYVGNGPYTPSQVSVTPKFSILEFNIIP